MQLTSTRIKIRGKNKGPNKTDISNQAARMKLNGNIVKSKRMDEVVENLGNDRYLDLITAHMLIIIRIMIMDGAQSLVRLGFKFGVYLVKKRV